MSRSPSSSPRATRRTVIARRSTSLRERFPDAEVIVADDGSRDGTAGCARGGGRARAPPPDAREGAGAHARRAGGAAGTLLLCDADLEATCARSPHGDGDLRLRRSRERSAAASGSRSGVARHADRALRRASHRASRCRASARCRRTRARRASRSRPASACETRMTIDAVRAGLRVAEVELAARPPRHRPRPARASCTAAASSVDVAARMRPQAVNLRGLRLPLVGWAVGAGASAGRRRSRRSGSPTTSGAAPSAAFARTSARAPRPGRSSSSAFRCVGLLATRVASRARCSSGSPRTSSTSSTRGPDARSRRTSLGALARPARRSAIAVLLAPYDLREMAMLGDAGSNALGAVLGLKFRGATHGHEAAGSRSRALAGLTLLGEPRSLGALIERTPVLRELDALGRRAVSDARRRSTSSSPAASSRRSARASSPPRSAGC